MKTRRIFMSLFAVIICAISVGIFKNAALGGDTFQLFKLEMRSIPMKHIFSILLLLLTVPFLCGCNQLSNYKLSDSNAVRTVEEKYNIELTTHETDDRIWCYTDEMQSEDEYVQIITNNNNGSITYSDNYFCYMIREDEEAYVQDIFSVEFPESTVYRSHYHEYLPNEYDAYATFEDALNNYEKYFIESYVFIPYNGSWTTSEMEEKLNLIEDELRNRNLNAQIYCYVISEDLYSQMNRYSLDEFFKNYFSPQGGGIDFETYYHEQKVEHLINFNE